jgi:hypothetical protein
MRKSEILFRAMQIAGIQNVDENRAKMVLAFVEKLETYGLGLSIREIEATGLAVTKQIQAENVADQRITKQSLTEIPESEVIPISKGGES